MAPVLAAKIESILEFATYLQNVLSGSIPPNEANLAELPNYLAILPLTRGEISQQQRTRIRKMVISVWNSCNKSRAISDIDMATDKNVCQIRTLVFLLHESVIMNSPTGEHIGISHVQMKHFHIGNETARQCLKVDQLEDATRIVQLLAKRYGDILNQDGSNEPLPASQKELVGEFMCLRIALEWRRDRLDLAEHQSLRLHSLIKKSMSIPFPLTTVETWLDLVYEIGVDELAKRRYSSASGWLSTARQFFELAQDKSYYSDLDDIKLNILHALTRSLLGEGEVNSRTEATGVLETLLTDYSDKLPVLLLELEILSQGLKENAPAIFARLMPIVRSAHMIDSNHKLVIFYVHRLFELSQEHGTRALQQYITLRLVHQANNDWTERAIITYLWMLTGGPHTEQDCNPAGIESFLDLVLSAWKSHLSTEAAHAGLVLLWKQIDKVSTQTPDQGVSWCTIGVHPIFEKAGEDQIGKIERKMISCYHTLQDYESARTILSNMSPARSAHHLSKYLAYCTHLKLNDEQETQSSLSAILSLPKTENKLLLACVGETMEHGSGLQSARLLQRLLDKYSNSSPSEVDVPALLRCTTKLLFSVVDDPQVNRDEILTRLCHVLKAVVSYPTPNHATPKRTSMMILSYEDCRWFEQHSFNMAVEHLKDWPAKYMIDVLQYSSQICYPSEIATKSPEPSFKRRKQELAVAFIQAVLYTNEARSCQKSWTVESLPRTSFTSRARPSDTQIQQTLYKNVFDRYCLIMQAYETQQQSHVQNEIEELHARLCTVLPLGFEALLHMNNANDGPNHELMVYDDLSLIQIIDKAVKIEAPPKVYALMADLILCAATTKEEGDLQNQVVLSVGQATKILSKIVQAVRNLQVYDMNQAARWIRCIVQLVIDHGNVFPDTNVDFDTSFNSAATSSTINLLKSIIDQAIMLATSAAEASEPHSPSVKTRTTIDHEGDIDMTNHENNNNTASHHDHESNLYPPDELEYLATILFNMAVDFYVAGNEDQAKWYAGKAIEIADVLALPQAKDGDRGMLAKVLRQKTRSLGWVL